MTAKEQDLFLRGQDEEIREAVKRGAKKLDRRFPGWHDRIGIETLSFPENDRCVLGQMFGTVQAGYAELNLPDYIGPKGDLQDADAFYGFNKVGQRGWDYVTGLWRHEIRLRRVGDQDDQ